VCAALLLIGVSLISKQIESVWAGTELEGDDLVYNGKTYITGEQDEYERGRIVYYSSNTEVCQSWVLMPGVAILPNGLLAVFYCLCLIYLFLGISIVSDIFMESIEKITSKTKMI
jgi:hypothetical protein